MPKNSKTENLIRVIENSDEISVKSFFRRIVLLFILNTKF